MASSGASSRWSWRNGRVPWKLAQKPRVSASDRIVAAKPVVRVSRSAVAKPGAENRSRHGCRLGFVPPSAGRIPNAGSSVPSSPAAIGPTNTASVSAGKTPSQPPPRGTTREEVEGRCAAARATRLEASGKVGPGG
jgi:hypothetical protein